MALSPPFHLLWHLRDWLIDWLSVCVCVCVRAPLSTKGTVLFSCTITIKNFNLDKSFPFCCFVALFLLLLYLFISVGVSQSESFTWVQPELTNILNNKHVHHSALNGRSCACKNVFPSGRIHLNELQILNNGLKTRKVRKNVGKKKPFMKVMYCKVIILFPLLFLVTEILEKSVNE